MVVFFVAVLPVIGVKAFMVVEVVVVVEVVRASLLECLFFVVACVVKVVGIRVVGLIVIFKLFHGIAVMVISLLVCLLVCFSCRFCSGCAL